jgi:hypothetical protein
MMNNNNNNNNNKRFVLTSANNSKYSKNEYLMTEAPGKVMVLWSVVGSVKECGFKLTFKTF